MRAKDRADRKLALASSRLALMSGSLADLPLNCPRCGQRMRYLHVRTADGRIIDLKIATEADIHVYQCAEHGRFHFSRDIPVRAGA